MRPASPHPPPGKPKENTRRSKYSGGWILIRHSQLDNALKHYRTLECGSGIAFDTENCTWNDVFRLLYEAKSQYEAKEKGFRGAFVSMARKAGDHADAVTPGFQLIPEQYGLGVLRASLCWMFVVCHFPCEMRPWPTKSECLHRRPTAPQDGGEETR